jgi:hypothetical protein
VSPEGLPSFVHRQERLIRDGNEEPWNSSASDEATGRRISCCSQKRSSRPEPRPEPELPPDEPVSAQHLGDAGVAEPCGSAGSVQADILLAEHDMGLVMNISDAITVVNFGRKIASAHWPTQRSGGHQGLPGENIGATP